MAVKKCLIVGIIIILTYLACMNRVYAISEKCYYTGDVDAEVTLYENYADVIVKQIDGFPTDASDIPAHIVNYRTGTSDYDEINYSLNNTYVKDYIGNEGECPPYIISFIIINTNSIFTCASKDGYLRDVNGTILNDQLSSYNLKVGTNQPSFDKEKFEEDIKQNPDLITIDIIGDVNKDENPCSIFGKIDDDGLTTYKLPGGGVTTKKEESTGEIASQTPPSLAYMIYTTLSIARIVAIALLILLGIIDFAKATLAGKDDEMRKHAKTFIKRVIVCIAIFFVPAIVRIIMSMVDGLVSLGPQCTSMLK